MARLNPEKLTWQAPTEDVNGNPITEALSYTLGLAVEDGPLEEAVSFPGSLNPDGSYSVAFADLDLAPGAYTAALKAFYQSNPDLESAWSAERIELVLGVQAPKAPFGLSVS